ncbi:MAG TPA: iron export ABC transporter permease subunit FetB [Longimicrobiales bacterium]|nr:iron export ABC transporter permease subunit FetB [Longimicrobiales bacterium]
MFTVSAMIQAAAEVPAGIIDVTWTDLALAFGLILVAIGVSRWRRLDLESGFIIGAIRAVVQLIAVGYVLVYIFAADQWWLVMLALGVMLLSATQAASRRARGSKPLRDDRSILWRISGTAMLLGSGLTLAFVTQVVLRVEPWYEPQYLIPLFGMIVGNAMNATALAAERLASELESHRGQVEAYLALGASPARAAAEPERRALTAALIPTINGLMTVGLVSLPGMMTGQILAGVSPLLAIRYQIVVMFMLAGATALTAVGVVLWYRRTFFTSAAQLSIRVPV